MAIPFPELPYATNALEPFMSQETLETHHGKHQKKYVETLNKLIEGTPLENNNLEEIMFLTIDKKQKIFNNAAQAWNHEFFFKCLLNEGQNPSSKLSAALSKSFGSVDQFKDEFTTQAKDLFGSGWTWLVKDQDGNLKIRSLGNAGNPIPQFGEIPLLTCDVWEHAYYLDYKNERPKFLENFWSIVNWDFVESNFEKKVDPIVQSKFGLTGNRAKSATEINQTRH